MRQLLTSDKLPKPLYSYSQMVKIGPMYQSSSMVGIDILTGKIVTGGIENESRKILDNLRQSLQDFQLSLEDMLAATIYTTRFESFSLINACWENFFAHTSPPARTSLGVSHLPLQASVMMEFRFYKEQAPGTISV